MKKFHEYWKTVIKTKRVNPIGSAIGILHLTKDLFESSSSPEAPKHIIFKTKVQRKRKAITKC